MRQLYRIRHFSSRTRKFQELIVEQQTNGEITIIEQDIVKHKFTDEETELLQKLKEYNLFEDK